MTGWFQRVVLGRRWLAFAVMGLAFAAFGAGSLNLFFVLRANLGLVVEHGWQALADGAAEQFVEIVVTGYLSVAAYLVFKACEYQLVHAICDPLSVPTAPEKDPVPHEDRHPAR